MSAFLQTHVGESCLLNRVPEAALDCLVVGPATQAHNKACANAFVPAASLDRLPAPPSHPSALSPRSHPPESKSDSASRSLRVAQRQSPLAVNKQGAG